MWTFNLIAVEYFWRTRVDLVGGTRDVLSAPVWPRTTRPQLQEQRRHQSNAGYLITSHETVQSWTEESLVKFRNAMRVCWHWTKAHLTHLTLLYHFNSTVYDVCYHNHQRNTNNLWLYNYSSLQDVLSFWIKKGVDGFRIDAINTLFENNYEKDEPLSDIPGVLPVCETDNR